ncbi:hypothetical protein ACWJJH_19905 [Endozoicomonadaceae bacterium StTr2]
MKFGSRSLFLLAILAVLVSSGLAAREGLRLQAMVTGQLVQIRVLNRQDTNEPIQFTVYDANTQRKLCTRMADAAGRANFVFSPADNSLLIRAHDTGDRSGVISVMLRRSFTS